MNPRPSVASALAGVPSATTALSLFSLSHRVALVTGGHGGIGLEMALALAEAGAVVYCLDLPSTPDADWVKMQGAAGPGRLEYVKGDVTDQKALWDAVEDIVKKDG
ncbi:unnamed protein product [Mycena citricolor]|uniref:NAD(P)-binding protein n=1 Tax=Mycena citricolor TaxID=2018698 RepID=A0AAD2JZW7_9AGAR|nr:unnamed protein product [Mycena citricolor]